MWLSLKGLERRGEKAVPTHSSLLLLEFVSVFFQFLKTKNRRQLLQVKHK